jgi:hypothetical protein
MDATPFLSLWDDIDFSKDTHAPGARAMSFEPADHSPVRTVTETATKKGHLASASGDRNDLRLQRWGVIAIEGPRGDKLLELVGDLRRHRAEQQGEDTVVYRVKPGMDIAEAEAFMDGEYWDKVGRNTERLPQYLLLLGDADGVSWQLQQTLARHRVFTGRLAFADDEGYKVYVEKVIGWEKQPVPEREALFYVVNDPSSAIDSALNGFLIPTKESVSESAARDRYGSTIVNVQDVGLIPKAPPRDELEKMLALAQKAQGGALVSVSHGVGVSAEASAANGGMKRATQGALAVSYNCALVADRLRKGPFLPGGAWFFFACFSAGTPAESAYHGWLQRLKRDDRAAKTLSTLAGPGEAPFVAALPQAALANPEGPLAVVGHVDLAWSWSYKAVRDGQGERHEARTERLSGLVHGWLQGDRFGPAHHVLSSAANSTGEALMTRHQLDAAGKSPGGETWQSQSSYLWLEYQDLNGYVLLGDPAAALPGSRVFSQPRVRDQSVERAPAVAAAGPVVAPADLEVAEEAALLVLSSPRDNEKLTRTAKKLQITADELKRRSEVYREAGRRALMEHLGATKR